MIKVFEDAVIIIVEWAYMWSIIVATLYRYYLLYYREREREREHAGVGHQMMI
jgi:hypothetical protein